MRSIALRFALFACAFGSVGCRKDPAPSPIATTPLPSSLSAAPAPVFDPTLRNASDDNPDPRVVEVRLTASPGKHRYGAASETDVWAYNGTVPGPLLDLQVGDRFIAHFKNELPEPTTIHWHGIRLPNGMDGNPGVVPAVPPGGTFRYEFVLKDAGLFWYHPHIRADIQVQKGLQGVFRVRGPNEPESDDERVWVLDDVRLKPDGSLSEYLDDTSKMMGREGNVLLVNGEESPVFRFRPGATVRLRIVNTANGRFFNLRLPGHSLRIIGTDGGLLPKPFVVDHLLVAPGERYDVMFSAQTTPGEIALWNDPYERGHESGKGEPAIIARARFEGDVVTSPRAMPGAGPSIERLPARGSRIPIVLDEGSQEGNLVFTVNGRAHPDVPLIQVVTGAVRLLDVSNASEMDHPFHLHGFFFQVVERDGKPENPEALANKDTIIVPMKSRILLAARFDEPGRWMYHCHILEHAEGGMMGDIEVGAKSRIPASKGPAHPGHAHPHLHGGCPLRLQKSRCFDLTTGPFRDFL